MSIKAMQIAISVPAHEDLNVIENQIDNYLRCVSDVVIVYHISKQSLPIDLHLQLTNLIQCKYRNRVYLNPQQYDTDCPGEAGSVTGLATVHCSNYKYLRTHRQFDIFAIEASNSLFIKKGLNDYITKYSCGLRLLNHKATLNSFRAEWELLVTQIYNATLLEGSWFNASHFDQVATKILSKSVLVKEEGLIIPTLYFFYHPEDLNTGAISWISYDELTEKHYGQFTYVNWWNHYPTDEQLKISLDNPHCFAIKRVPRKLNHPFRERINNLIK